jgi:hypothetical protein
MLKIKLLAAATTAALFAVGGAVAQSSTTGSTSARSTSAAPSFSVIDKNNDGQISRQEWSEYERTARPAAGIRSDKQPTATTGPRDAGGSDKAKNPGASAGAAAGSTSSGATTGSTSADKKDAERGPTAPTGEPKVGGSKSK